jgi:hypothetical protein
MRTTKGKLGTIALAAAAGALALVVTSTPSYAWQWGAEDQENYEFNPVHRDEILRYSSQWGSDWATEVRASAYAQKQPGQTAIPQAGEQGQVPEKAQN